MKQIKANHLKWCEYGFKFTFCEKEYKFKSFNLNENIEVSPVELDGFNLIVGHPPHLEVSVDEDKYKDAMIEKLRELFENKHSKIEKIEKKQTGDWRGYCYVTLETASTITELEDGTEWWCTSSVRKFPTNIDLMPWEKSYEITI